MAVATAMALADCVSGAAALRQSGALDPAAQVLLGRPRSIAATQAWLMAPTMLTLVDTSTNLVVHSLLVGSGTWSLDLLDITPSGAACAAGLPLGTASGRKLARLREETTRDGERLVRTA